MTDQDGSISRRTFVAGMIAGGAALWIDPSISRTASAAESRSGAARQSLSIAEWETVEAMTSRILPTDDLPGAVEAGCVGFIDRSLANEDAAALPLYRIAIAELERISQSRFTAGYKDLSGARQDRLLEDLETNSIAQWRAAEASQNAFFETVRIHTILGFVLDPRYGGNRDYVGWKTMGFPGPVHHLGGSQPDQMLGKREFVPIWERGAGDKSALPTGLEGQGSHGLPRKSHPGS